MHCAATRTFGSAVQSVVMVVSCTALHVTFGNAESVLLQLVMQYLYNGGCETLQVEQSDVLELMAAANFFQLNGLLRYCEAQCSSMVDLDNIVSMYIHAKVL
jgi:hypothetical protein